MGDAKNSHIESLENFVMPLAPRTVLNKLTNEKITIKETMLENKNEIQIEILKIDKQKIIKQ